MPILTNLRVLFKSTPLSVWLTIALLFSTNANGQHVAEYKIKAVFIYNFVNFVEWPASAFQQPSDPFVIGIVGQNVFGNSLHEVVTGETYHGRHIEVRHIDQAEQAEKCHIVFIEKKATLSKQVLAATGKKPVLTIADSDDFMQQGGMVRFFFEQNKIKLEVNQPLASDHGLVISSKLLRFARLYNE